MTTFAHTIHTPTPVVADQVVTSTTVADEGGDHTQPSPDHVSLFTDRSDARPDDATLLRIFAGYEHVVDVLVQTDALRAIAAGIITHADYLDATTGVPAHRIIQNIEQAQEPTA